MTPRGRPPAGLEQTRMVREQLVLSTWLVVSTNTTSLADGISLWILYIKSVTRTATYPPEVSLKSIICCGILVFKRCIFSKTDMLSKLPWFCSIHLFLRLIAASTVGFTHLSASSAMSLSVLCFSWWYRRAWPPSMPVKDYLLFVIYWALLFHIFISLWFDQLHYPDKLTIYRYQRWYIYSPSKTISK